MFVCNFCESTEKKKSYFAREMMYGFRDQFEYIECAHCGGLQISNMPPEISKYYPKKYYSFIIKRDGAMKRWLKRQRYQNSMKEENIVGKVLVRIFGVTPLAYWLKPTGVQFSDTILDVGCGNGFLILQMHDIGFTNLTGIDPYIEEDQELDQGIRILKSDIHKINGNYKLIMYNHSFEHVVSPFNELSVASRLLNSGQFIMIRIPIVGCFAWRKYGTDWVQLDAPRHLSIPTIKSMEILAKRVGLIVDRIEFDSSAFQLWGSEQYRKNIPLRDDCSYGQNPKKSIFSKEDIQRFNLQANQLNLDRDGDQVCFYLRKV